MRKLIAVPLLLLGLAVPLLTFAPAEAAATAPTLISKSTWVMRNKPYAVRGTTWPGGRVWLQKHYANTGWATERRGTGDANGFFALFDRDNIQTMRVRWYRVCNSKGCSGSVRITPYEWRHLHSQRTVVSRNLFETSSTIDGTYYANALWEGASSNDPYSGYRRYDLNRKCRSFTGVYGLGTSSSDGSEGRIRIFGGDRLLWQIDADYYDEYRKTLDIRGVDLLGIHTQDLTRSPSTWPAIGGPRVLCAA